MPAADFFTRFGLLVVRDFLEEPCRAEIRSELAQVQLHQGGVYLVGRGNHLDESTRRVRTAGVTPALRSSLHDRLLAFMPTVSEHFGADLRSCFAPDVLVYGEGDYHRPHCDTTSEPEAPERFRDRKVAVVIFVNGESAERSEGSYGGGALAFYRLIQEEPWRSLGFPLTGEPGLLVAFPADLVHEVRTVTRGQRQTVVSFYI